MLKDEEQKIACDYVLRREISRPETNILKAMLFILSLLALCAFITLTTSFFYNEIPLRVAFIIILFLLILFFSKRIIVGIVELYQHYAPELLRRKCICMPTCSEYMISAVEKYGVIKGLFKGLYRVRKTCKGLQYKIDYP